MTKNEKDLAALMLELASDEFSNHGCNDVDNRVWERWTTEERKAFVKEYYKYNGDPDEYDERDLELSDYAIMNFLGHKLAMEAV